MLLSDRFGNFLDHCSLRVGRLGRVTHLDPVLRGWGQNVENRLSSRLTNKGFGADAGNRLHVFLVCLLLICPKLLERVGLCFTLKDDRDFDHVCVWFTDFTVGADVSFGTSYRINRRDRWWADFYAGN